MDFFLFTFRKKVTGLPTLPLPKAEDFPLPEGWNAGRPERRGGKNFFLHPAEEVPRVIALKRVIHRRLFQDRQ